MKYFEFDAKGKIMSGEGALKRVQSELALRGKARPFVLSDRSIESLGLLKTALKGMGLKDPCEFLDIPTDSSVDTVNSAVAAFGAGGCDCVIAIGGGSVIDTAKGVVLALVSGESDLARVEGADNIIKKNDVLFIAVPTTAGTGSEVTSVAVIKDAKKNTKLEYISTFILPDVVILDPEMTLTLPPKITASTAIDALTHAIEAYTCLQKNPISDAFAVAAIKLIFENLEKVVDSPKDKDGRGALATAATLAGMAFSNSMVGAVHSIGHALGAVCRVAHGDAMAILLGNVMVMNMMTAEGVGDLFAELLMYVDPEKFLATDKYDRGMAFVEKVRGLIASLGEKTGLSITLGQTGRVERAQFDEIAEKALNDGSAIVNPTPLTKERILAILDKSFDTYCRNDKRSE